jgi:hypothetical protein
MAAHYFTYLPIVTREEVRWETQRIRFGLTDSSSLVKVKKRRRYHPLARTGAQRYRAVIIKEAPAKLPVLTVSIEDILTLHADS